MISDPAVLFAGVLDHPDNYEEGVAELLQELAYKKRDLQSLRPEERALLDRATLEFAAGKRPKPKVEAPPPSSLPRAAQAAKGELGTDVEGGGALDIPDSPPTFWWRKG